MKEIRKSSRIDDKVVQDQRQRDDYDLQDERQDQSKEEESGGDHLSSYYMSTMIELWKISNCYKMIEVKFLEAMFVDNLACASAVHVYSSYFLPKTATSMIIVFSVYHEYRCFYWRSTFVFLAFPLGDLDFKVSAIIGIVSIIFMEMTIGEQAVVWSSIGGELVFVFLSSAVVPE
nr:hypothetical protein [Tanacetum cinerariifolium]